MVQKYGTKSWALIAENLSKEHSIAGRSGKQCRERWHNHLGRIIKLYIWDILFISSNMLRLIVIYLYMYIYIFYIYVYTYSTTTTYCIVLFVI